MPLRFALALAIVSLMGFISLSYEILWYRAYSFVSGSAPAVFGLLLAAFLLGLAIGAVGSRRFCRDRGSLGEISQLRIVGVFIAGANIVGFLVVPGLATMATRGHWAFSFPLVTLAAGLFGASLPLISHFGIRPDQLAGARLSYIYLANIIGSAAGSLITGFVFLDTMTLRDVASLLAFGGMTLATLLLLPRRYSRGNMALAAIVITGTAAGLLWVAPRAYHRLYEKLLYKQRYSDTRQFRDIVETRSGVVTISPAGAVFGSGAFDGTISTSLVEDRNGIVRAYAIAALHPHPRRILMIGLATGAWAHVLSQMPGLESLTVVEINPGYLRVIATYPEVSGVLQNPKVRIVIDDGRRWLARHPEEMFDVIVSNTTWHWRAHTTNLLSLEYLQLVRRHLLAGGIYYFNTTSSNDAFYTAFTAFPYGVRFKNFAGISDTPIHIDSDRWRRILSEYALDGHPVFDLTQSVDRARLDSLLSVVNAIDEPVSARRAFESRESVLDRIQTARAITDDNMAPEWHRTFEDVWLPHSER